MLCSNSPAVGLFFVVFIIICAFFTLNLFVGVVIDNFNRLKDVRGKRIAWLAERLVDAQQEYEGSALLTEAQRQYNQSKKMVQSELACLLARCCTVSRVFAG